ncbi:MAG TPA: sulfurtransferase-like selenium metabolism protein YedF [Candidatus Wallbacteria bacterium]|nr:sulfurtransferase-like selenium metabolism protein YedF [Candidatus Wallbacteria bacterium]
MDFDNFYINISKETSAIEERILGEIQIESSCFLVKNDFIGESDALGHGLIKSLFYVMAEKETKPSDIILINRGVLLAASGSPILSALCELERSGVSILCCGTSLNHYKMHDSLSIGYVSNMYDILEVLMRAKKVVSI